MAYKEYTEAEKQEAFNIINDGYNVDDYSKKTGISRATLYRWLDEAKKNNDSKEMAPSQLSIFEDIKETAEVTPPAISKEPQKPEKNFSIGPIVNNNKTYVYIIGAITLLLGGYFIGKRLKGNNPGAENDPGAGSDQGGNNPGAGNDEGAGGLKSGGLPTITEYRR